MMPDVSGFDVVDALQRDPDTARIPILVVTAKQITEADRAALNSEPGGVVSIVDKAGFNRPGSSPRSDVRCRSARSRSGTQMADDADRRGQRRQHEAGDTAAARTSVTRCCARVDAETGLTLARAERPDLILMDIQLPGMDGLAATALLKHDPATATIPVIALTAMAMKDDREKSRVAGCDAYIAKPLRYRELYEAIDRLLEPPDSPGHSGDADPAEGPHPSASTA